MINERMALKMRLEQLDGAEIRIIKEFNQERENIFKRLRYLDEKESRDISANIQTIDKEAEIKEHYEDPSTFKVRKEDLIVKERKMRRGRPSRRSKSSKMREAAIKILQEHKDPIKGSELQKMIEETTGLKIANMTTFMKTVEKADLRVKKPYRGLYQYV